MHTNSLLVAALSIQLTVLNPGFAQTWTETSAPLLRWFGIASSADGNKLVAGAYTDGTYISTSAGVDWTKTSAPGEIWNFTASAADGSKLAAANFGSSSIYVSTDSGTTWTQRTCLAVDFRRFFGGTTEQGGRDFNGGSAIV